MDQEWFEMPKMRSRFFERAVWIPLRSINTIEEIGKHGFAGYKSEFFGAGSLAVPLEQKDAADKLGWMDIGISHSHSGYIQDDEYTPANVYKDYGNDLVGEHLVMEQRGNSIENTEWHLSQDFVITLGLKREDDIWVCPDDGYVEAAKVYRRVDGSPYLLEVRASYLRDYLCARKMALRITSYRDRVEVSDNTDHIKWGEKHVTENNEMDRWEGRISEIHEGGMPFGSQTAIFHVGRTDVDPDEDVPTFDFPANNGVKSESWTQKHQGRKLFRIEGELWRTEWVDPATNSPIVRGDKIPPTVYFITDSEGTQENKETLARVSRWLWFRPEVISALAHRRGGYLGWHTSYTGSVSCSPDYSVHFGINRLGLVNVYAKDIGELPDWQQKIWAGYNVSPDGKVSEELLASQMRAEPADTQAPEAYLSKGLKLLNEFSSEKLGIKLMREHHYIPELLKKSHRFRATDKNGLYALAKDIARLTADSIDTAAIQKVVSPPKGSKWGSLKSLENLIATKIKPEMARKMLSSLVGVYELRHGDAHLPSTEIDEAFALIGIDQELPYVHQGYQLLSECVSSIYGISEILRDWDQLQP
ncbi:MAG: hypothetical protein GY774_08600 [Planctomycetes bacterium]|nr:hypothetical protein [Planctomycetota bacterium]